MNPDLTGLHDWCAGTPLEPWSATVSEAMADRLSANAHGDWPKWQAALDRMPERLPSQVEFTKGTVVIGDRADVSEAEAESLTEALQDLIPWRKGPFEFFGTAIDTEWRSDWKWNRLCPYLDPLDGRAVLDVGCGNGYYLARMWGEGIKLGLGVDPTVLFSAQYLSWRRYVPDINVHLLPVGIDDLPSQARCFDTVFSMGVLYHRRSPMDHLMHLKRLLRPGGQLVLETLVVSGDEQTVLVPSGRYAGMRNVWFVASASATRAWLERCGFQNVQVVDECVTQIEEQRATPWMPFHSLENALDGDLTVEGHERPTRAILTATTA